MGTGHNTVGDTHVDPNIIGHRLTRRRIASLAIGAAASAFAVTVGIHRAGAQDDGEVSTFGLPLFETTDQLNLRSAASLDARILLVIPSGAEVQGSNRAENGFREVTYSGTTGWASADYLVPLGSSNPNNPPALFDGTALVEAATNFRSGASLSSSIIRVVPAGTTVSVSDLITDGFRYSRVDGTNGWLYDLTLSPTGQSGDGSQNQNATTTAALNLRNAPNGSIVLVMPEGATLTITGSPVTGFLPVTYNGTAGWASAEYLTTGGGGTPPTDGTSGIVTTGLNLRASSSISAAVLLVIPSGATIGITGAVANGFLPVTYDGTPGWASAMYIRTGDGVFFLTTTDVNLREEPRLDASVLTVLPEGAELIYAGTGKAPPEGWAGPFDYGELRGYVWAEYVVAV